MGKYGTCLTIRHGFLLGRIRSRIVLFIHASRYFHRTRYIFHRLIERDQYVPIGVSRLPKDRRGNAPLVRALVLDVLFLLCLRLGYESTRLYMNDSIRAFFACFQSTYDPANESNRSRATSILGTHEQRHVRNDDVTLSARRFFCGSRRFHRICLRSS